MRTERDVAADDGHLLVHHRGNSATQQAERGGMEAVCMDDGTDVVATCLVHCTVHEQLGRGVARSLDGVSAVEVDDHHVVETHEVVADAARRRCDQPGPGNADADVARGPRGEPEPGQLVAGPDDLLPLLVVGHETPPRRYRDSIFAYSARHWR